MIVFFAKHLTTAFAMWYFCLCHPEDNTIISTLFFINLKTKKNYG